MNETELERLVVRLTGDMSGYMEMLKKAQQETAKTANDIDKNVEQVKKSWVGVATSLAGAVAGMKAGEFFKGAFSEFSTAETIGIRLGAVLKANGRDVEETTASYKEFADQLQRTTKQEDDATLALLKQAESFDLTGGAAKRAVKDSLALAEINDSSAQAMIRLTAAMAKGDTETAMLFARMVPQLRGVRDETEFTVRYQRLIAAGLDAAAEAAGTTSGKIKQLENDYGNLKETLGEFVAEGISPIVEKGKALVAWFERQPPLFKEIIAYVGMAAAAFVLLATNGENLLELLTHIGKEMKEFGKTILGMPPHLLLVAAAVTAFAITLRELSKDIDKAVEDADKLNRAFAKIARKPGEEAMERVATALPQDRRKIIDEELQKARNRAADQKRKIEQVEGEINRLTGGATAPALGVAITGSLEGRIQAAEALLTKGAQSALGVVGVQDADVVQKQDLLKRLQQDLASLERSVEDLESASGKAAKPVGSLFFTLASVVTEVGKRWKEANMEKVQSFLSEAAEITERVKTPLEKAAETRVKLLQMLLSRVITQDTYARAMKELEDSLLKAADAQAKLNQEMRTFNTFAYGSRSLAEELAREFGNTRGVMWDPDNFGVKGIGGGDARQGFGRGAGAANAQGIAKGSAKGGRDVTVILEEMLAELRNAGVVGVAGGN